MKSLECALVAVVSSAFALAACSHGGGSSSSGSLSTATPASSAATPSPVTSGSTSVGSTTPAATTPPPRAASAYPIDHVFIIFKENHTFDNYFGSYPGADGAMVAKDSNGSSVPLAPYVSDVDYPGNNSWGAAHKDWNNGAMDQFDIGEGQGGLFGITALTVGAFHAFAPQNGVAGGPVRYYWQLAAQGVLCDAFFTSVMSGSSPNHVFSVAAQCGGLISNEDRATHQWTIQDANGKHVKHPNHFSPSEITTALPVELEKVGLTWKYFAESQGGGVLGQIVTALEDNDASVRGIDVIAGLPDFAQRYDDKTPALDANLAAKLASGDVGHVTWIKPSPIVCEHPGIGPVGVGVDWTRKVVNAIGASQYWERCAIIITYDDYGGFYDHVAPPQLDAFGCGFRVPCIIVSPYAKKGFIDHTTLEHSSLCKLAETLFGLPAMTARDAQAADMLEAFDFTQAPRSFADFKY